MDQKLKERLLGAVIILSILVFVLPILFKQQAPIEPTIDPSSDDEDVKVEEPRRVLVPPKPLAPSMPKPVPPKKAAKSTRVWVLRMGIFTRSDNAKLLAENLFSKGYRVYSSVDKRKGTPLTRVFVGPYQNEHEVKKARDRLKKELNIEGLVLLVENSGGAAV